jgi:hypothetical protein
MGVLVMAVGFAASISIVKGKVFATYVVNDSILRKRCELPDHFDCVFTSEITGWGAEAVINHRKLCPELWA